MRTRPVAAIGLLIAVLHAAPSPAQATILRYSRASVVFPLLNSASGVHADVGGAHAGGGLRFYF